MTTENTERDELAGIKSRAEKFIAAHDEMIRIGYGIGGLPEELMPDFDAWSNASDVEHADTVLAVIESTKPRQVTTIAELDALPVESAVRTSDTIDTVVLKGSNGVFRNADGHEVPTDVLWRYGTRPFTVIYSPVVGA